MFGQVLEKLDSWIGRFFLLARFFPWLLFAAANLAWPRSRMGADEIAIFVAMHHGGIRQLGRLPWQASKKTTKQLINCCFLVIKRRECHQVYQDNFSQFRFEFGEPPALRRSLSTASAQSGHSMLDVSKPMMFRGRFRARGDVLSRSFLCNLFL